MKIVTVDVLATDDEVAKAAVRKGVEEAKDADRLLLFGHAALVASRMGEEEREEREGAWLDAAAAWLLSSESSSSSMEPPPRPAVQPLARATAVVSSRSEGVSLPRADRHLEMAGALLVMAVVDNAAIDSVDNAHLWLVGGGAFDVAVHTGGRAIVAVGDRVVVVEVKGGECAVVAHDFAGNVTAKTFGLQVSTKMSVRGASA